MKTANILKGSGTGMGARVKMGSGGTGMGHHATNVLSKAISTIKTTFKKNIDPPMVKRGGKKMKATVVSGGEGKFPIPDKAHAVAALARIDQARPPLSSGQKAKVRAKARRVLGHATPATKP